MVNKRALLLISVLLSFMFSCSIWVSGKQIVGDGTATRLPATSTPLVAGISTKINLVAVPSLTPTLAAQVTAMQSLNVRERAGEDQAVAGYVFFGDSVTLTGNCDHGWAEIVWGDGTAWVNASYLSENKCSGGGR